jgi:CheY-like chemotaxis protein
MTAAASKSVRLLVAEDNPLVRDLIADGMEPHCEVIFANDGADALLKVIDEPPDAILCDYKMPGLDGRQLFEKLRGREKTRHIPFLFMASRAEIEEKLRPLTDGVEDFVAKPFLLKDLVRAAKKVVERFAPRGDSGPPRRNEHDRSFAVARNGAEVLPPPRPPQR